MNHIKKLSEAHNTSIGEKGKERVRKFLHKMVDKYMDMIDPQSDDNDNGFFVRDFNDWYKEQN